MTQKLLVMMILAGGMWAAELTQGERDRAMSELHASRKLVEDKVRGLSKAQLVWKPAADQWSIAEIVEHLAETEQFLLENAKKVGDGPADPNAKAAMKDEELLKAIRSREQKVKAPEPVVPKAKFATTEAALKAFHERRLATIAYVETTKAQDLRLKIVPQMQMDGYQMFLLMAAHAQRHVDQMAEIQGKPGYPGK